MNEFTKLVSALEKNAAAAAAPAAKADPVTFGEGLSEAWARRGKLTADAVAHIPKALGLFGAGLAGTAITNKLFNKKPSLVQEVFGRGGLAQKALLLGAVGAGIGGAASAASAGVEHLKDSLSKDKNFDAALAANPSLKEFNRDDLRGAYDALHKFSPDIAREPLTTGAFLRRSMMFKDEGIQPTDVKTLVDIRKALSDSRKNDGMSSIFTAFPASARDVNL